jgi:hypothetical protein
LGSVCFIIRLLAAIHPVGSTSVGPLEFLGHFRRNSFVNFPLPSVFHCLVCIHCAFYSRTHPGRAPIAETQPKLQPRFLRLRAMISQYFILCRAWLLFVKQRG